MNNQPTAFSLQPSPGVRASGVPQSSIRRNRGFTLTEVMIAVAVLIVVIIATSKIFGTATQVTGQGQALASVMQEAAAIEQRMRDDIDRLCYEGFFAIHCVAVYNDINGAVLLNPDLPPDAVIRADQLVFFTNGVSGVQNLRNGVGAFKFGEGTVSRVYYGHAYQLPNGPGVQQVTGGSGQDVVAFDFLASANPAAPGPAMEPWDAGTVTLRPVRFQSSHSSPPGDYFIGGAPNRTVSANQPLAPSWLLVRAPVLLADDDISPAADTSKNVFLSNRSCTTATHDVVKAGRVDACAQELSEIRFLVTMLTNPAAAGPGANADAGRRNWLGFIGGFPDQYTQIKNVVFYPRAERKAPSMHRVDQALTNNVIGSACSSFIVDWTYDNGVGYVDPDNNPLTTPNHAGCILNPALEQPWFGLSDNALVTSTTPRGVRYFGDAFLQTPALSIIPAGSGFPNVIESNSISTAVLQDYWAVFGYNRDNPPITSTGAIDTVANANIRGYTPWPSAIRVTMTLHDPDGKLEGGREFQFVINLPRRGR